MKFLLEVIISIVLHPLAMILAWINILGRSDMGAVKKILWIVICTIWGLGPIFYMLLADGSLW